MKISELKPLLYYQLVVIVVIGVLLYTKIVTSLSQFSVSIVLSEIGVFFSYLNSKKSPEKKSETKNPPEFEDENEINQKLSTYLKEKRKDIFNTIAPGSTELLIREILEKDKLFISLPWANYSSTPQSEELIEHLMSSLLSGKKILLLGNAGQGKSTILKRIFSIMIDSFVYESSNVIPIYIPFNEFADSEGNDGKTLLQLWEYLHNKSVNKLPLKFEQFTSFLEKNDIVFLFDGLDERVMELNQQSINESMNSEIFDIPSSILSCRKSFYEVYLSESIIQQHYLEKIELLPLEFTESLKEYIATFCDNKGDRKGIVQNQILSAFQKNSELQEFAKNPLLLTMVLDVFSEPGKMTKINWNRAKLYEIYTEKWLKNEAVKPDSKLNWFQKSLLLEEIAWSIYQKGLPSLSTYDDMLYNTVKLKIDELYDLLKLHASNFQSIPFDQIVDDICHRSLLIGSYGGNYYFTHKSFQEYYIAKHIINCMKKSADDLARALKESTPSEIADFLEDMLKEKSKDNYESNLITNNLIEVYKQNAGDSCSSLIIREHSSYYLACIGTKKAEQFLEQSYKSETNKWVQRGMMVGLGIFCNREDIIDEYIDMLHTDPEAASINIAYNLAYCGDQSLEKTLEEGYCNKGKIKCNRLIWEIFYHLKSEKYKNGWALDILILRTLLQDNILEISNLYANYEYIQFLNEFLSNNHVECSTAFHKERKLLQEFLASTSIEGNYKPAVAADSL